jgi:DNA polymerase-1
MARRGLVGGEGLEDPIASTMEDASQRAAAIQQLIPVLRGELDDAGMLSLLLTSEIPMAACLARMELTGMPVNPGMLRRLSDELGTMAGDLQTRIFGHTETEFNINSPKQVASVLFDQLGLEPIKKTSKSKNRSTDSSVLEALSGDHPVPGLILEWRNVMKLKGTYADALPSLVHPGTGRIHSSFHQDGTATGRLSSSDPNLQNIPIRSALGARIRRAFEAPEGDGFLAVDYSQIDLRALAHLSGDPALVSAFQAGRDIHTEAAALLYDVPIDQVDKEQRRNAKAINFGIIYGMGPHRLKGELGIGYGEAKALIERYNERFAGVSSFFEQTLNGAMQTGYVTTLLGRRRFLPVLKDHGDRRVRNPAFRSAERMARNTPVQGTSADILRVAMVACDRILSRDFPSCRMVLQVHDELIFLGPVDVLRALESSVVPAMEGVIELSVPLVVHPSVGTVWSEI